MILPEIRSFVHGGVRREKRLDRNHRYDSDHFGTYTAFPVCGGMGAYVPVCTKGKKRAAACAGQRTRGNLCPEAVPDASV